MTAHPRRAGAALALPLTLDEALAHLHDSSDGGANDAFIESLIETAVQTCEDRTERALVSSPWLLQLDAFPCAYGGLITLLRCPVIAIQSIQYLDVDGDLQTLSPALYQLDPASEPARLLPAPGASWPATQAGAVNAVRIAFTAGYGDTAASVPKPLKQWMLLAITEMNENRSASAERPMVEHQFADGLLRHYRILGV